MRLYLNYYDHNRSRSTWRTTCAGWQVILRDLYLSIRRFPRPEPSLVSVGSSHCRTATMQRMLTSSKTFLLSGWPFKWLDANPLMLNLKSVGAIPILLWFFFFHFAHLPNLYRFCCPLTVSPHADFQASFKLLRDVHDANKIKSDLRHFLMSLRRV